MERMPGKSNRPQAGHPVCRRRSTLGGRVCCTWSSTRARSVATLGASCPRRHARQRRAKSRSRLREERSVTRGHAASGGAWRLARELREQACEWTPAATHAHTRQGTADSLKTGLCDMSSNSQHSSPASSITCLRSHVRSARLWPPPTAPPPSLQTLPAGCLPGPVSPASPCACTDRGCCMRCSPSSTTMRPTRSRRGGEGLLRLASAYSSFGRTSSPSPSSSSTSLSDPTSSPRWCRWKGSIFFHHPPAFSPPAPSSPSASSTQAHPRSRCAATQEASCCSRTSISKHPAQHSSLSPPDSPPPAALCTYVWHFTHFFRP